MKITAVIMVCLLALVAIVVVHTIRLQGAKYRKLALLLNTRNRAALTLVASLKGLEVNPWNKRLHGYAAHALMNLKKYRAALMHLDPMLKYYPYDVGALVNAAYAHVYVGDLEKAFEMRDRVKIVKPSYVKR